MLTFIAYFDILGFKQFIDNNSKSYVDQKLEHLYRESQYAVCHDHKIQAPNGDFLPDFNYAEVNCLHISDSILFWTTSADAEDFQNIVNVCHNFLRMSLQASFPMRGCLVAGDIEYTPFKITNGKGFRFDNNLLYGKGLIDAYLKAEFQDWAGCYVDPSAFELKTVPSAAGESPQPVIPEDLINGLIYDGKLSYYPVPLKDGTQVYRHAFRLIPYQINNVEFRNRAIGIEDTFKRHQNGRELDAGA